MKIDLSVLPDNFIKEISDITGFAKSTVIKFLENKEVKTEYIPQLIEGLEIYLIEHEQRSKTIKQTLKRFLDNY